MTHYKTHSKAAQNLNIHSGRYPTPLIAAVLKERRGKTSEALQRQWEGSGAQTTGDSELAPPSGRF